MKWKDLFTKGYWVDLFNEHKHGIRNGLAYQKVIWGVRPWSIYSGLELLKHHLEQQLKNAENESFDNNAYVNNIANCIFYLDNILKDNFYERCNGRYPQPLMIYSTPEKNKLTHVFSEEERERQAKVETAALKLKDEEWVKLTTLLKNLISRADYYETI